AGLPDNPTISPIVEAWKGISKYAGMALVGFTALASVVHRLVAGPNTVSAEDQESADKLASGGGKS
ncbi:MAG: formate dehydrogenase subunit beta, partial [Proteobacteria bacterium]|nr:formate dehydrogenase subunit beta [Pseudomonadota bacterium]